EGLHIESTGDRMKTGNTVNKDEIGQRNMCDIPNVMEILGISYATYCRFVKSGMLIPRKLGSRDSYYPEDLVAQVEQAVRTNQLLEQQNQLLKKQQASLDNISHGLSSLHELQVSANNLLEKELVHLLDQPLLD